MKKVTYPVSAAFGFGFHSSRLHGHAKPAGVGSVDLWHGDRVHTDPSEPQRRRASDTDQSRHVGKANPTDRERWPILFR